MFRRCLEHLANLDLDILTLQEVDRYVWRSGFRDLARIAVAATGMRAHFGKAMGANLGSMINPGGEYGNLLLVRGEIQNPVNINLNGDYKRLKVFGKRYETFREPRNAISAHTVIKGHEVAVVATHLGGKERFAQLGELALQLSRLQEPYKVLLGDFNMLEPKMERCIRPSGLELAKDGPWTNPAPIPDRSIDHVAVGGLDIINVDAEPLPLSDHLARIVEVRIPAA